VPNKLYIVLQQFPIVPRCYGSFAIIGANKFFWLHQYYVTVAKINFFRNRWACFHPGSTSCPCQLLSCLKICCDKCVSLRSRLAFRTLMVVRGSECISMTLCCLRLVGHRWCGAVAASCITFPSTLISLSVNRLFHKIISTYFHCTCSWLIASTPVHVISIIAVSR
jgi:hypothetical protein